MKAIFTAITFGALTFLAAPSISSAADLGESPIYSPTPAASWHGFYAGLHGGLGSGFGNAVFIGGGDSPADFGVSGLYLGGQLGYNWQNDGWVFGLEGDLSWSGISGTRNAAYVTTETINWLGSIRGRLGVPMGAWMPYVTGGFAFAQASRYSSSVSETVGASHAGWVLGLGAEWLLSGNWSMKGEYKYYDLGSANYMFSVNPSSVHLTLSTFELGFNYRY